MAIGDNGRRGMSGPARVAVDAAGYVLAAALAGLAALRRGKAVHPHGAVYEAELVVERAHPAVEPTELLGTPGRHPALVRFSRSLGLPRPLPDLLGMSLRVPDAYGRGRHQDLLMVTSVDAPVLHHLFVPAADVQQRPYSSSLPYRAGGRTLIVGALPRPDSPRVDGDDELDRLAAAAATGRLAFDLAVADVMGRFRPVARLEIRRPLPPQADALRFNPWNTGGGLELTGVLNRLRDYAYPLSQRAWGRRGGREQQHAADAAVPGSPPAGGDGRKPVPDRARLPR